MKISVISPVKNEAEWIGYSIMAVLPYVHEIIYAAALSSDGTDALLEHIKGKYAGDKLKTIRSQRYEWKTSDTESYNRSYNDCIEESSGDAVWFLHPDMIVTNPESISKVQPGALAYWTTLRSLAGDFNTVITRGRATKWKNIHMNKFGLKYSGAYGSKSEDFYHEDITGKSLAHYGENFRRYPFKVFDSGIEALHLCEVKPYSRRLEKMKSCLKNMYPAWDDANVHEVAVNHPRVTLEGSGSDVFGRFEFTKTESLEPEVIRTYRDEFEKVIREAI